MPLQSNVNVDLRYAVETTLGTQGAGSGQKLRRVSSTLALSKDAFTSNEVRPDMQVYDARHGTRRVAGNVQGELSTKSYDDWIEAALRGTWATGASITQATAGMATATLTATSGGATATTGTFTASAGSFITSGLRVGDVIRVTGSTGNTNKNFRVVSLTATVATVTPNVTTATAAATWGFTVQGKKLVPGTTGRSFTIEQHYPDLDISETFLGCRVADLAISVPPTGIATASFGFQGVNMSTTSGASAPVYGSPTAAASTNLLAGISGSLSIAGVPSAIVTGLDFQLSNNLSSQPVVGSTSVPEIFYGRITVNGTISAYVDSLNLINYFLNETEISLAAELDDSNGTDFLMFQFPRIKLMGMNKTVGPDGGVMIQSPFQALLSSGVSGVDDGTILIQRSNAV